MFSGAIKKTLDPYFPQHLCYGSSFLPSLTQETSIRVCRDLIAGTELPRHPRGTRPPLLLLFVITIVARLRKCEHTNNYRKYAKRNNYKREKQLNAMNPTCRNRVHRKVDFAYQCCQRYLTLPAVFDGRFFPNSAATLIGAIHFTIHFTRWKYWSYEYFQDGQIISESRRVFLGNHDFKNLFTLLDIFEKSCFRNL